MAKVTNKKNISKPVEEVIETETTVETTTNVEGELSEDSDSEGENVDGFSSDEESNDGTKHNIKKLKPKNDNKKSNKKSDESYSGIIYISRLPRGFHEKQLSKYFSQFGDLRQVKLARNKKTGNSRHYGFVEFINKDDAKIAQEAMNNYLVLGHLLKVVLMPKDSKIEKLIKYKSRKFVPNAVKKSAENLKKNAIQKHEERLSKLSDNGIEFKWN